MAFITNYLQNTAATYLSAGVTAVGSMAGNAVGGVGSLVESGGRSIGEGSEHSYFHTLTGAQLLVKQPHRAAANKTYQASMEE